MEDDSTTDHDWYAILGVPADAAPAVIFATYRRLAKQHHPDYGGSHAQMVLLNKALEVLRDPDRRRQFDEARKATADAAAKARYQQAEAAAQAAAERYPTEWDALEKWWRSIEQDLASTQYGNWLFDLSAKGGTVELMMLIGGGMGFGLGVVLAMNIEYPSGGRAVLNRLVGAIGVPTVIGAVAGKVLHYLISSFLRLGGLGKSPLGIGLSEPELRRIGTYAILGLAALTAIAVTSEPRPTMGMTETAFKKVLEESFYGKLQSGVIRGALLGAVACFVLTRFELAQAVGRVRAEKLPPYFSVRAAAYGGLVAGIAGFTFEFLSIPQSSGMVGFGRMVTGALLGAAAGALTMLTIKQTGLPEAHSDETVDAVVEPFVVPCVHCGKKLRIPRHDSELKVTCPACSGKFAFDGETATASTE